MTLDNINRWAVEARCFSDAEVLMRFAELVAAHEREQCAKVCEAKNYGVFGDACAAAIRARK